LTSNKAFSKKFATFAEWLSQAPDSPYKERIVQAHSKDPRKTLQECRGHPREGGQSLSKPKSTRAWKLPLDRLSEGQARMRSLSRKVYSKMKNEGLSLESAASKVGITPRAVLNNLNGFVKKYGRWMPKANYKNSADMLINSQGQRSFITVGDFRSASVIGQYHNAVRRFYETGDVRLLSPFVGRDVKDASGMSWKLETDSRTLYEIRERQEDEEFYDIYRER
jgi:hypothetical protein